MKHFATTAALAVGVTLGGAVTASAAIFDFTDEPFLSGPPFQGSVGGRNFEITFTPPDGDLTFNGGADAPGPVDGDIFDLAGEGDGLGIDDDEVTNFEDTAESITITFDGSVRLSGLAFLDLFLSGGGNDQETAIVEVLLGEDAGTSLSFIGTEVVGPAPNFGTGFAEFATNLRGTSFRFTSSTENDDVGRGDYALAAIEVAAVPLPASVLLLGGALGGLGLMRRRRS